VDSEVDEVGGACQLDGRERSRRFADDRRQPECGGDRPQSDAGIDPTRGRERRASPVEEGVLRHERHVDAGRDDDHGGDDEKGTDVHAG
jgi:hypothetical protein